MGRAAARARAAPRASRRPRRDRASRTTASAGRAAAATARPDAPSATIRRLPIRKVSWPSHDAPGIGVGSLLLHAGVLGDLGPFDQVDLDHLADRGRRADLDLGGL